ncbi:alpha/beta hydrolase [Streptomyces sp. NPDC020875]|uniref:alpha/beta fold hydrolase n=1 Tax=Streptomyces sp. NPDC020875 TaxID=3154898 RepID=UPI0033F3B8FD
MRNAVAPHTLHGSGRHGVIALHGWFSDRSSYLPLFPYLDTGGFTWAAMDQRGYGEARGLPGPYTTERIARDALALAGHLGWDTFSLVGHSMGGKAAQHVLALAPDRVRALVGISPVPASGAGLDDAARRFFASAADDPDARRAIISTTTGDRLPGPWLDHMVRLSLANSDREAFAAYLPDWAGEDFSPLVRGSSVPALALAGAHDPAISADALRATWLRHYPRGTLDVLPDTGHYAIDETPLALLARIENFLAPFTPGTNG